MVMITGQNFEKASIDMLIEIIAKQNTIIAMLINQQGKDEAEIQNLHNHFTSVVNANKENIQDQIFAEYGSLENLNDEEN